MTKRNKMSRTYQPCVKSIEFSLGLLLAARLKSNDLLVCLEVMSVFGCLWRHFARQCSCVRSDFFFFQESHILQEQFAHQENKAKGDSGFEWIQVKSKLALAMQSRTQEKEVNDWKTRRTSQFKVLKVFLEVSQVHRQTQYPCYAWTKMLCRRCHMFSSNLFWDCTRLLLVCRRPEKQYAVFVIKIKILFLWCLSHRRLLIPQFIARHHCHKRVTHVKVSTGVAVTQLGRDSKFQSIQEGVAWEWTNNLFTMSQVTNRIDHVVEVNQETFSSDFLIKRAPSSPSIKRIVSSVSCCCVCRLKS